MVKQFLFVGASALAVVGAAPAMATTYNPGYSSTWWAQIGLTTAIEAQASGGTGSLIALVDTGVVSTNAEITGRVSSVSSCAAVTFTCSKTYTDDNGHGTATASIAAGMYNASTNYMSGVAPGATILAEKVLSAAGTGYDTDVANGITKAANAGAKVINLSLTYTPTVAEVTAINYAASKGAVIVFAGGNSSAALNSGVNSVGFTTQALQQLIFVGSVSSANKLSTFSDTPGTGMAVVGTASNGSIRTSYSSLWLMAPGENIIAPATEFGATSYAYWTGTSMSAPMVAGAISLLETTWPVLYRNGDAAAVLLKTATDLGTAGVDSTYGNGLLDLTRAFQPVGALSVVTTSGAYLPVTSVTSATITGGALGSLSAIQSQLSAYTAFDTYLRNFTVNLSGLVKTTSGTAAAVATAVSAPVTTSSTTTTSGGKLTLATSDMSFMDSPAGNVQTLTLVGRTMQPNGGSFYLSLTNGRGDSVALGRGLSSTASFADALYGEGAPAAYQSNELGVGNALMSLAQGGYFGSVGAALGDRTRLAATWTSTPERAAWGFTPDRDLTSSAAAGIGLSTKLTSRWSASVTFSALNEQNGLLGTTFDSAGLLSLGQSHQSSSVGFTTAYNLGSGRSLLFDAMVSKSSGAAALNTGLFNSITPLTARAFGVSFVQANAFQNGDHLTISVRQPLRVTGGSVSMLETTVDANGYPITTSANVSLRPSGNETDIGTGYSALLKGGVNLNTAISYRTDADNIRGSQDVLARLALSKSF